MASSDYPEVSEAAHHAAVRLIIDQGLTTRGPDFDSAILCGVAAGLADVMWRGRTEGYGVREVCDVWNALGKQLIGQAALHSE